MIRQEIEFLLAENIQKERIWILSDSWYDCETIYRIAKEFGTFFMVNVPKDRQIRLFKNWFRVDKYFETKKKERYFTSKKTGEKVYYKEATLDISKIGRCKVFAFRPENTLEYRYYVSNKLDLQAKTAYEHYGNRWSIEDMHRSLKQYCGLENCYSGKKETNLAHKSMSYFLYWIFSIYKTIQERIGFETTFEKLWIEYTNQFDLLRYSMPNNAMVDICKEKTDIG